MSWSVILSRNAVKDAKKLGQAGLKPQTEQLLKLLKEDPFARYPRYEKLLGNLEGFYSALDKLTLRAMKQKMKG